MFVTILLFKFVDLHGKNFEHGLNQTSIQAPDHATKDMLIFLCRKLFNKYVSA